MTSTDRRPPGADHQVLAPRSDQRAAVLEVIRAADLLPADGVDEVAARLDAFLTAAAGDDSWLVVDSNGAVAGVAYTVREPMTDGTWNLLMLAVHPDHQGRGLGAALVHAVEDEARGRGARLLVVETSGLPSFAGQRRFYTGLGYTQQGSIPDFYGAGDDKVVFATVPLPERRTVVGAAAPGGPAEKDSAGRVSTAIRVLLLSGSLRTASTNTAVLRTAALLAPPGVETVLFDGMRLLPHFDPDLDREGAVPDVHVERLRSAVRTADALLICTPEYAGALPGAFKNLLEWTVGDGSTYQKPVALINASSIAAPTGGADAHQSLRTVLQYVGADIVEEAVTRLPMSRAAVADDGLIEDARLREVIRSALGAVAGHASRSSPA